MSVPVLPSNFPNRTFALDPDLNVRLLSCDNASSFDAAWRFGGGAPQPCYASWGIVVEGSDAADALSIKDGVVRVPMLPGFCGERCFVQGNPNDLIRLGMRVSGQIGGEVIFAFAAFYRASQPAPSQVMGILNVTPDSFSDGGQWVDVDAAVERALDMIEQGAEIIDIGGESSRPGAVDVPPDEELLRVLPVLQKLRPKTKAQLSIDTRKAAVALQCLDAGADMINDVSGLTYDPELAGVVAKFPQAQLVLMHQRRKPADESYSTEYDAAGKPVYEDVVADTMRWLRTQVMSAVRSGVYPGQLWIDPGFGFGKTYEQNVELLRRIREYTSMGLPILLGTSRKSSVGRLQGGGEPDDRLESSLATACWAVSQGVRAVRVHDVRETVRAVRAADALRPRVL